MFKKIVRNIGSVRRMLLAHNWRNHHHMFNSLRDAIHYAQSTANDVNVETNNSIGDGSDRIKSKEQGFKSIFQKGNNNHAYHLIVSDESEACVSDTDIDT